MCRSKYVYRADSKKSIRLESKFKEFYFLVKSTIRNCYKTHKCFNDKVEIVAV